MAEFFERLEPEHRAFIEQQHVFFVATAVDGAHPNLSPKGYETLAVLAPERLAYVDWPGSGNQTGTHVALHGRITLMFCSFERSPLILRVYGQARVVARHTSEFDPLAALLAHRVSPHTRQLIDIRVQRVQTSCGYAVPLYEYQGERETLEKYYVRKRETIDWDAYLRQRTRPQGPPVPVTG